jgi:hypothetical protein
MAETCWTTKATNTRARWRLTGKREGRTTFGAVVAWFLIVGWPLVVLLSGILIYVLLFFAVVCAAVAVTHAICQRQHGWGRRIAVLGAALWILGWPIAISLIFDPHLDRVERLKTEHHDDITALANLGLESRYQFARGQWWVFVRDRHFDDAALEKALPYLRSLPAAILDLRGSRVTERGLDHLDNLPHLERVLLDQREKTGRRQGVISGLS